MHKLALALAIVVLFISGCCPLAKQGLVDNAENWQLYGAKYLKYVDNDPVLNDSDKAKRHKGIKESQDLANNLVEAAKGDEE